MPILSGSALRAKQVSMTVTPAKRILGQIILCKVCDRSGVSTFNSDA
jgi:hypothetical protein